MHLKVVSEALNTKTSSSGNQGVTTHSKVNPSELKESNFEYEDNEWDIGEWDIQSRWDADN